MTKSSKQPVRESTLVEAERLINGERAESYGPAKESFTRIAALWSIVLGIEVKPEQVAMCMLTLKVGRWVVGQQRDSIVDIAGYAELADKIVSEG